jgi:tetratricopeptide (TPR) repeat protein
VWNQDTRAALHKHADAMAPWAPAMVDKFAERVEKYGTEWKTMYLEACEATRAHGTQSEEALDLRMACLDHRLDGLRELVTLMADAKFGVLRNAGDVVDNLPPVSDCGDVKALRQVVRRPSDPKITPRLDALDRKLAKLSALYAIGDVAKTVDLADEVIAEAESVGYAPPLAQALYWRGRANADRGGGDEAEKMFDKTFSAALSAGEDGMAADAAARIAQEALWTARMTDFERWQRVAHALASRVGALGVIAFSDQLGCMANHWTGRPKTRLACLQELVTRKVPGLPNEWLVTTLGIAASEAGAPAEAIRWLEQGVDLARSDNGVDHPRTLEMRAYLCNGLNELGDYKRAATECKDALERIQKVAPDDKLLIARLQLYWA